MKRALIQGERICDIVNPGQEFEVHPSLQWVDVADDTTSQDTYNNGVIKYQPPVISAVEQWELDMKASDQDMPRWAEDLWDVVGLQSALQIVKDNHAAKKALRNQKP